MPKGKVVFITGLLSQPRCIKRVKAFLDDGFECHVYGYNRGKYDVNKYPVEVHLVELGVLEDGTHYLRKTRQLFRDIRLCVKHYKDEKVVFYAFGFIQALILKLLKKPYAYEVSDILYAYPRFKRVLPVLKYLDKKLIIKSVATTMTSGGFYNFYGLKNNNIFIVPNKVSPSLSREAVQPLPNKGAGIRFGFVGAIRYETVFRFAELIGKYYPNHSFHFWGGTLLKAAGERLNKLQNEYSNVFNHGVFRNPSDLPLIYSELDVVVACYTVQSLNERLAEPNKLYEAIFFCKPIVVSTGIYLSERVEELHCGYCLDATSDEGIKSFIDSTSWEGINRISSYEFNMPKSEFVSDQQDLNAFIAQKAELMF